MCCLATNPKASPGSDGAVMSEEAACDSGDMTECSISHLVAHGNGQKRGHRERREAGYMRKPQGQRHRQGQPASKAKSGRHFYLVTSNSRNFFFSFSGENETLKLQEATFGFPTFCGSKVCQQSIGKKNNNSNINKLRTETLDENGLLI